MAVEEPEVPEGFVPEAWHTFPSLHGVWKPSKVHLAREDDPIRRHLCGARRARRARSSALGSEMREHMRDAGQCVRCLRSAKAST